jgi:ATP-dependent helicase HrpB
MLLAAKKQGLGVTACLLISLLTERDLLKGQDRSCDLRERIQLFQDHTDLSAGEFDKRIKNRILKQTRYWKKLLHIDSIEKLQPEACGILLAFAYPDRLAVLRKGSLTSYQLISGKGVMLRENDHLTGTPFLAAAHVDERRAEGKIHLAAPVDESDLRHHLPELFSSRRKIGWDDSCDRIQAVIENRIGSVVLSRNPFPNPNPEKVLALFLKEIQKRGIELLPWTEEARQFQARVVFLRLQKNRKLPDISNESLWADLDWLAPFCYGMTGLADLKRLELKKILHDLLSWDLLQHLEKEAPTHIIVPSGSKKKLIYTAGTPPILAVRLQEMFGLDKTPAICQGQVSLSLHLLSPANRPLQITSDLASFWRTAYPEIRKELAGRYPKHYWPEDPLSAKATTLTKKAMQRAAQ